MSVICYEPEKFQKIAVSLKEYKSNNTRHDYKIVCWAYVFGYPENWDNKDCEVLEYKIDTFVNDLYRANQQTYLRQYQDKKFDIDRLPWANKQTPYDNKVALYKALQSIDYNICDNEGQISDFNGCEKLLNKIITYIANDIIMALPEYNMANVW